MNKRQAKKMRIKENKKLIAEFPFLLPRNRWTDKVPKNFNYEYTELDSLPKGWKKAFGILICKEIKESLVKENLLYSYRITQIKEKYGSLRWYDCGGTAEIRNIIYKYEYLSQHICINCGKFDVSMFDDGWISPYCNKCFCEMRERQFNYYKKYLKDESTEFNKEEVLKRFRLEDEPIKEFLKIETISKGSHLYEELDLRETINKIKNRK